MDLSTMQENLSLSRRCDDLKRKIMNMEREMESFRAIGTIGATNGVRKLSRVGRAALSSRQTSEAFSSSLIVESIVEEKGEGGLPGDKENSGMSFFEWRFEFYRLGCRVVMCL